MIPMTLANMRENGVRSLSVYCPSCHRQTIFNVDSYDASVPVPAFGPRMRCTTCGTVGADVRPNWTERAAFGAFTGYRG
jgi:hypothetical protein